ncbi:S41 family peptidase [Vitiosangium sp. GDMCC 1.1324]|uniref:S41 family peptidase n=1 Tax=Vitiosangium sp. (strain GDMCC 1.1324) TaxID=2138576 RepID=UPI000D366F52|nr:S41 family peptidase [Vitiosangium sp. GDMCC 1.1324]PTL82670.1 peptidase S41 [Vitiosangium sp. GDMCC 1.1324]
MPRTLLTSFALAFGLVALTASAAEPPPTALPSREERLDRLARLWGQVRYRHPYLAYKDIDWDAALVAAIPRVEAAKDRAAYATAVQDMLEELRDPATRILRPDEQQEATQKAPTAPVRDLRSWEAKDVLVLDLRAAQQPAALALLRGKSEELRPDLAKAKAVIVDLRARGVDERTTWSMNDLLGKVLPLLLTQELQVPGERSVYHSGYRPQSGGSSGGYAMSFLTSAGELISPQGEGKARPVIFLLDDKSYADPRVLTMKAQGQAQIVTEGRLDDGAAVQKTRVELGGGLTAVVRLSELGIPLRADAVLPKRARSEGKDDTLQKALELARKPAKKGKARELDLPPARWQADRKYEDMLYPKREYRLLALFRLWNVIQFFYPYKHLMDRDWDGTLATFLPKFEKAKDAAEYALAVAEMSTLIQDGHTGLRGHPELEKRGLAGVGAPFELMEIEGQPVVVGIRDAEAAPGLAPGQVVETIDGKPLAERVEALKPYVTASHPVHLRHMLLARAMMGPEGSQATLGVRDAAGQPKQVRFTRSVKSFQKPRQGEAWRVLPDNIGYVDLTRLQVPEVAGMFEKLKNTKAIVFDMRGYPKGTAWSIVPYLNTRKARYGAVFERNVITAVSEEEANGRYKFFQELPKADVPFLYRGRTVMLIDERAISQSEHSGLFFEAANGTTFIGSPSAGANGDVTDLVLPGGITLGFTGHDVRHLDGRQLQRVGLRPQVFVRPTILGVQAGKDEVLDKALEFLKGGSSSGGAAVAGDSVR